MSPMTAKVKRIRLRHLIVFLILCILMTGCLSSENAEIEKRISRASIQVSDLPFGFQRGRAVIKNTDDTLSQAWTFRKTPSNQNTFVLVSQQIILYADASAAHDAYSALKRQIFPTSDWVGPAQLSYETSIADQFHFACIPSELDGIPAYTCSALGQYGDMTSVLYANVFQSQGFTWEDMERVLGAIDDRMAAEMQ